VGPVSGDPVRDALSALRAARRRGQATAVDAAVEALSARASDPLGAPLSPPRLDGEPRELDDKDAPDRESEPPDTASRPAFGGPSPPRPPDIRLLAIDLDDQVTQGAARRAGGDAASAESDDKPKLPEVTRYAKHQLNYFRDLSWHQTVGHARDWLALSMATDEPAEAVRGFLDRRS